jgi:hypothetical protein
MNGVHYINKKAMSFRNDGAVGPITGVTFIASDGVEYFAGSKDGYVISANCPYATQEMANDALEKVYGRTYRAFDATGVYLPADAELGDAITVCGTPSMIAHKKTYFGSGHVSDVSAPAESEINHEFPYTSTTQKVINQTEALRAETKVLIDRVNGITVTGPDGTTKVRGGSIETDTLNVKAANVSGTLSAEDLSLNGELILDTPASAGPTALGYVGATASLGSTQGVALMSLLKENYVIATATGAKLASDSSGTHVELSCFGVPMSGNYGISASHTINVTSDKRLKNSISYDMEKYEPFFGQIKPCIFRMNNGGDKYHMGFIAQDLLEASNSAGLGNGDLSLVNEVGDHYAVGYTELISLNTHMIQKLTARVAELEEKISNMEAILNG